MKQLSAAERGDAASACRAGVAPPSDRWTRNPFVVVAECLQLPRQVDRVPEEQPIEILAAHSANQPFDERMRRRGTWNRLHLLDFECAQVGEPPVEAEKWLVISRGSRGCPWIERSTLTTKAIRSSVIRSAVFYQDAANDVLLNLDTEGMRDLLSDAHATELWVAHLDLGVCGNVSGLVASVLVYVDDWRTKKVDGATGPID